MKRCLYILFAIFSIFTFTIPSIMGHVPIKSGKNDSLENALHIDDPKKSWAIYDELDCICAVRYYKFDLRVGDRLRISIFTPEEHVFAPNLVIMIPGGDQNAILPYFVETPTGYGPRLVPGERSDKAGYEPFTPSSLYRIIDFAETVNVSGTYYIAVFDSNASGKFGLAIGYIESFTLEEWIMIPFNVMNIHLWEGQELGTVLLPLIIIFIIGIEILLWRKFKQHKPPDTVIGIFSSVAALLFIGSGAILFYQMVYSLSKMPSGGAGAVVTAIFAIIPIFLGWSILKFWLSENKQFEKNVRVKFIIFGLIGIFLWAGYLVGPIVLIISNLLPMKKEYKTIKNNENSK